MKRRIDERAGHLKEDVGPLVVLPAVDVLPFALGLVGENVQRQPREHGLAGPRRVQEVRQVGGAGPGRPERLKQPVEFLPAVDD